MLQTGKNFLDKARGMTFDCIILEDVDVWLKQNTEEIMDIFPIFTSTNCKVIITGEVPTIYDECYRGVETSKLMGEYLKSDKFKKIYIFGRPFGVGEID